MKDVITYRARAIKIEGRELADSVPSYAAMIIHSQLMLVISSEWGHVMAAGTLKHYRKLLRDRRQSADHMHKWPKYYNLEFDMGLEPLQVQPTEGQNLMLNAAGMIKLSVIFDGKLSKFLSGNNLNNARRFMHHVAGDAGKGSMAQYSFNRLDAATRWMIASESDAP